MTFVDEAEDKPDEGFSEGLDEPDDGLEDDRDEDRLDEGGFDEGGFDEDGGGDPDDGLDDDEPDDGLDDDLDDEPDDVAETPLDFGSGDVIATARRRYGGGGALLAAGLLGLDRVLTDKKKAESVQVQEAASDPIDVDRSGIQVLIDERTSVEAPPLERRDPLSPKKKRSRRR